ncbi:hypothetical protein BLA23254_07978 [Burkholderia lata]|uniref:FHA domain-containing protein n=1 Tax=Burkholderia lata (strain ATCC 17760 / DSM 23089 / LMG 22485 / NCIMB 9086 / R18194 / 383) TaxID=482957 RepID=A0A6P2T3M6_BURL3|nr:4Fe-4S binding protein [Burkholderia lata]VWC52151.1 hypothetical protein BLA23254_07978 [Burkholderia lata]
MFARTPEKSLVTVRAALFAAWIVLIVSLFWDPMTPTLTDPSATGSPFHVHGNGPSIQGHAPAAQNTYAMGARIWWTMIVPIIPLFLMVFGHETWRRVCPLSFASQIPRYLGWVRKASFVQRHSGKVIKTVAVIGRGKWLDRNALYVQMGLLYLGLTARLLFANADRHALAFLLLLVIAAAVTVGALWGGRTWCHYVCPINVVQKIYTEPRGLLESAPHVSGARLGQSACRISSPSGDQLACVGCTTSCSDIDLEGSYWDTVKRPIKRHVYYIFYGLICGFYGYYYLYAGNWDYYFSGYWTHETNQLSQFLDSGFFIAHRSIPIPKLIAAPLTLATCGASSLALGTVLEGLYRGVRHRMRRIPEAEIVNHCLSFTAFLSINTFYLFGGRPSLLMLPAPIARIIDVAIVILSSLWFFTAIHRTPFKYRQEALAASLLGQLKKLKVDVSRYMDGRSIDDLQPDEVYVLSKVLPAYTREQKVIAYKRILDEMISQQKTTSAAGLQVLHDLRGEMGISTEEHARLIDELGHDHAMELDPSVVSARERAQSVANYARLIASAICKRIELGDTFDTAFAHAEFQDMIRMLRPSLQIEDEEHKAALTHVRAASGALEMRVTALNEQLMILASAKLAVFSNEAIVRLSNPLVSALRVVLSARTVAVLRAMLSLLRAVGPTDITHGAASTCARLFTDTFVDVMMEPAGEQLALTWKDALDASLINAIVGVLSDDETHAEPLPAAATSIPTLVRCLHSLANDGEPLHCAIAAFALAKLDRNEALNWRQELLAERSDLAQQWLVAEVMETISRGMQAGPEQVAGRAPIVITVQGPQAGITRAAQPGSAPQPRHDTCYTFDSLSIRIGSDRDNDLYLPEVGVAPQHFLAHIQGARVVGGPLGGETAWLNGLPIEQEAVIRSGDVITLTPDLPPVCTLIFVVPAYDLPYTEVHLNTVTKLSALFASGGQFRRNARSLEAAGDIARRATVRRYPRNTVFTPETLQANESYILATGSLRQIAAHREYAAIEEASHDEASHSAGTLASDNKPAPTEMRDDASDAQDIVSAPARMDFEDMGDDAMKRYLVVSAYADLVVWQEAGGGQDAVAAK